MSGVPNIQAKGKVLSVTLNTAIDHIIKVQNLIPGSTIRALGNFVVPAGKGIDVAVGVATLGERAVAAGFIGAQSREIFATLERENVELLLLDVPGHTRTNVTVLECTENRETHLQTTGYSISQSDIDHLAIVLDEALEAGDVAVISGSVPPNTPEGVVAGLVTLSKNKGAYVILDGSGRSLSDGLRGLPHMIKPNLLELAQITGDRVDESYAGIVDAAKGCLQMGLQRVVVSCGYRGIVALEHGQSWKASVDIGRPFDTAGVGSGDALVAAFAAGIVAGRSVEEMVRWAVACAAASLLTDLPGRFRLSDVTNLLPQVAMEELKVPML